MEILITIALIIITSALGFYIFVPGLNGVLYGKSSHTWPSVEGIITKSKVVDTDENSKAVIHYRYWVRNKNYLGKEVGFCKYGTTFNGANLLKDARNITYKYPKGMNVLVYYHPSRHGIAVLETGFRWASVIVMSFGLMIIGVGVIIAVKQF